MGSLGDSPAVSPAPGLDEILEGCLGCKWTRLVLRQVQAGVARPGAIERALPGLTAKVLAERLAKLQRFGILRRTAFPEVPPRVEYALTPFGDRLAGVLDQLEAVRAEFFPPPA